VYEYYWRFASNRQQAFERRLAGLPAPWSDDPILQEYKFCNVFRACDRVSQYMIAAVCYHQEPCTPDDRLFQITAFRTFSRIATWEELRRYLGRYPTLGDLASGAFEAALERVKAVDGSLYTGAFILCASNYYGRSAKHRNHVELFKHMFLADGLGTKLRAARTLRGVYDLLHTYPMMGDFMSYQTAIDLNYSDIINFDENDFTKAGPGALRGIAKCFESLGDYTPEEVIMWMVAHQDEEFARLGLPFHGLFGRKLHAIDCQGLFCEADKYCRVAVPELTSARKRIKARFSPQPSSPVLFFPPKWGINEQVTGYATAH
jgi:hypothetical protein